MNVQILDQDNEERERGYFTRKKETGFSMNALIPGEVSQGEKDGKKCPATESWLFLHMSLVKA